MMVPNEKNIILTGFMGTGKTTVGQILAARLGYEFVDTDVLIEARTGRSIPAIFAEDGEAAFRQLERDIAAELAVQQGLVIATGGRLMLDPANAAALGGTGRIFCLTATPELILARVLADEKAIERPLLQGPDPATRIRQLLAERAPLYAQFDQVDTTGLTAAEVAEEILRQINLNQ
ncbi:MAG: shikimate kinase [Anaerolineales bacterium]|nr:shikimate kinase [Anaerolineales bacterium]